MAQQPAVVIIARHGLRLDASDSSWHLSTPTPYDPPLTYGGWTQCRTLGVRIAELLDARERSASDPGVQDDTVRSHDYAQRDGSEGKEDGAGEAERPRKRRRIKHKVVIHSSPFLRCLQTSVAIAAGMAQYKPTIEAATTKTPTSEPKHSLHHAAAKRALHEHKRHRKSKLRVDAFLGEWLNPEYFADITPPPPSAMMVTSAKAELMQNDSVEIFTPTVTQQNSSGGSLWNGAAATAKGSKESTLDDWSAVESSVPSSPTSTTSRRDRASTVHSSGGSSDRAKSPFRPGGALQPLTSTVPKQETTLYHPPQPHYAISPSQQIPRGYVAHARNACTSVDYQWDSSRAPLNYGDGGELGEEWGAMHRRFRRGLNHLVDWYGQHSADERSEDALGFEQAERHAAAGELEEESEETVLVMVTHGAGCNALIGAITGQPVLLDVGMASLTMAVRRGDAPPLSANASSNAPNQARRFSMDMGLSSVYEMRLVASSEHLRPSGASTPPMRSFDSRDGFGAANYKQRLGASLEPPRSNTSSALGSIRRPSAACGADRSNSMPPGDQMHPAPAVNTGLWTPPASRASASPILQPQRPTLLSSYSDNHAARTAAATQPSDNLVLDFSNSPPESRPGTSYGPKEPSPLAGPAKTPEDGSMDEDEDVDATSEQQQRPKSSGSDGDIVGDLPSTADGVPQSLSRGLSQKALWGTKPSGARVERKGREMPKRRWTVDQD
ncbi:hypothetical protein LTR37_012644 [Vermiconidia calcicola]|uniref:Uncharacterized protein n=1 Tax=Vermiconidia calcicola TaxID=1690605 RepID=A0ACC3MYU0_9PEZI|nr:hypothetical protein LTR37_012644 [Vermiconidia calcicola]